MKKRFFALLLAAVLLLCAIPASAAGDGEKQDEQLQERFSQLTDEQKAEIYALNEAVGEATRALLEKYAEFGVLDQKAVEGICAGMTRRAEQAQQEGRAVGLRPGKPRKPEQ